MFLYPLYQTIFSSFSSSNNKYRILSDPKTAFYDQSRVKDFATGNVLMSFDFYIYVFPSIVSYVFGHLPVSSSVTRSTNSLFR